MKEKSPDVHLCVVALPDSPRGLMEISTAELMLVEVVIVPLTANQLVNRQMPNYFELELTFSIHIGIQIQLRHVCRWR